MILRTPQCHFYFVRPNQHPHLYSYDFHGKLRRLFESESILHIPMDAIIDDLCLEQRTETLQMKGR